MGSTTDSPRTDPGRQRFLPLLVLAGMFLALFLLYQIGNDFPAVYHPDEAKKTEQVLEGWRNFHHPSLMLNMAEWTTWITGKPSNQGVVLIGRTLSAFYCALTGVFLIALAWRFAGPVAAVAVFVLFSVNDQVFEAAHYFKEDPALLLGLSGILLSAAFYWPNRGVLSLLSLGFFAAVAVSSKYFGVIGVVLAFGLVAASIFIPRREANGTIEAPRAPRVYDPIIFISMVLAFTLLFNYQIIWEFADLREGLTSEVQKFEDDPTEAEVPHTRALNFLKSELLPLAWIPIFAFFLVPWRRGRRVTVPEWLCAILPLLVILILTFSSRSSARYMLPVAMMTPFFIGAGTARLFEWIVPANHPRLRYGLIAAVTAAFLASNFGALWGTLEGTRTDTRAELVEYIRQNVPEHAFILADENVYLPGRDFLAESGREPTVWYGIEPGQIPQYSISHDPFAAEFFRVKDKDDWMFGGPIKMMQAYGLTHVAVSEKEFDQFIERKHQRKKFENFRVIQQFYDEVFEQGELLWESETGRFRHLNQGLRLYKLPEPTAEEIEEWQLEYPPKPFGRIPVESASP
jgi:hypothetical protein